MEDAQLLKIWKQYDKKLEESLVINRQCVQALTRLKVQSLLASMKPVKTFAVLAGILWVAFLDVLIITFFRQANPFFLVAAILMTVINKLAIGIYLYQLILIHRTDISGPVLATQQKLAFLKSSTLWAVRILFLQLPLWTIFYWNKTMLQNSNWVLFVLQTLVTLSFLAIAIWLFLNLKYENRQKKWFRLIFNGPDWNPLFKSAELLQQMAEYR